MAGPLATRTRLSEPVQFVVIAWELPLSCLMLVPCGSCDFLFVRGGQHCSLYFMKRVYLLNFAWCFLQFVCKILFWYFRWSFLSQSVRPSSSNFGLLGFVLLFGWGKDFLSQYLEFFKFWFAFYCFFPGLWRACIWGLSGKLLLIKVPSCSYSCTAQQWPGVRGVRFCQVRIGSFLGSAGCGVHFRKLRGRKKLRIKISHTEYLSLERRSISRWFVRCVSHYKTPPRTFLVIVDTICPYS